MPPKLPKRAPLISKHRKIVSLTTEAQEISTELLKTRRKITPYAKLKMLPDMPVDIIFAIFSFLEPGDLLQLLQTSKQLRVFLISKSSRSIWKESLSICYNDGLPQVPDGLNEIQWASLAVSQCCHQCNKVASSFAMWAFYIRLCTQCSEQRFVSLHEAEMKFGKVVGPSDSELPRLQAMVRQCVIGWNRFVDQAEVDEVTSHILRFSGPENKTLLAEYTLQRCKNQETMAKFVKDCVQFECQNSRRIEGQIEQTRLLRVDELSKHLEQVGYGAEIFYVKEHEPEYLLKSPFVASSKDISDPESQQSINDHIAALEMKRGMIRERLLSTAMKKRQRLLRDVIHDYALTQPIQEIIPKLVDFCVMPCIEPRLINDRYDQDTSDGSFKDLEAEFPLLCEEWKTAKTEELRRLLPEEKQTELVLDIEGFEKPPRLNLAITFFQCFHCAEPISYPRILIHSCTRQLRAGMSNRDDEVLVKMFINLDAEPYNWTGDRVVGYHAKAESAMLRILDCLVLDPEMTTAEDLDDDSDIWLECVNKICDHKGQKRIAYRWRNAVMHDLWHQAYDVKNCAKWMRLDDEEIAEEEGAQSLSDDNDSGYICAHCRVEYSGRGVRSHLEGAHSILQPQDRRDFIRHPDTKTIVSVGRISLSRLVRKATVINLVDSD